MRVVQIGGFHIGAQRTIEESIHQYLQQQGDEGYIGYAYGESLEPGTWCYTNSVESILTRGMRKIIRKKESFALLQTIRLIMKLRKLKPDIIHLHVIHDGYIDYVKLFKFIIHEHIPVVYTMHDLWAITGGCYHYTHLHCDGFTVGCKYCPAKSEQLDCARSLVPKSYDLKKKMLSQISMYASVAVSKWVSEELHKSYLVRKPIFVVYNCIDQPDLKKIRNYPSLPRNRKYRLIGIANNWNLSKGIDKMYEIAKSLGFDYEILLVGNIDDYTKSEAPGNISFFGYCQSKDQMFSLLCEADLYVCTSLEETFGMTIVEAACVGTRSIGFDSTAVKEILRLTDGFCVTDLSTATMCNEIKIIIEKAENKLLAEKVEKIKALFSVEKMSQEYYQIYKSVINQKV